MAGGLVEAGEGLRGGRRRVSSLERHGCRMQRDQLLDGFRRSKWNPAGRYHYFV